MASYKVMVCTENHPKGAPMLCAGTNEPTLFESKIDAIMYAKKVRENSSIGVYFKIEEAN